VRVRVRAVRTGISIRVVEADRQRLDALVAGRDTPQKHVWRAQISLPSAAGVGTNAVMGATGKSKTTVWRWQARFMAQGLDGLLHDKTRPPGGAPASDDRAAAILAMTLKPPPHEATHRTARAMAGTVGIAVSTVRKIGKTHGLAPHRRRGFKRSNDPAVAEKPHDVVGLSAAPPAHAIVLSVDEKSQIQALDRPQPGLPFKKGRGASRI
jgi:transposase